MKLLIKIFFILIIIIIIALYLWGDFFLEHVGSYALRTPLDIREVRFLPHRFIFKLYGINLSEKRIFIKEGVLSLIPLRGEFYGLRLADKILLRERNFSLDISRHNGWEINLFFKGVDISKFNRGFEKGKVNGTVEGVYSRGNCALYGILYLNNIVYSDSEESFLGISSEDLKKLIEIQGGHLELDFTYKGPINEFDQLYRYKPGRKTMNLIKKYIVDKFLSKINKR